MIKNIAKCFVPDETIYRARKLLSKYFGHNSIKLGKGNTLLLGDSILKNCVIDVKGENVTIEMGGGNQLSNCDIRVFSSDCHIYIGSNGIFRDCTFWLEDRHSSIHIGNRVKMTGRLGMGVVEGTTLTIGDDCLFSSNIQIMTTDSHTIYDLATEQRINPSKDVTIGRHVWVGHGVSIGKGVSIADDVVVGAASYVSKSITECNTIVAGVPAKILKRGIGWDQERR